MNKRKLGKTDMKLTALGFGGAPLGNLFKKLNESTSYKLIENSLKSKINMFDTSPFYGCGLSEHRLGNYLKNIKENKYYLSTKVGRYLVKNNNNKINRGFFKGGLNFQPEFDYSYDGVMKSFEQSLQRLAATKIDICLIHDVDRFTFGNDFEDYYKIAMKGAYRAINKLRDEKVIKAIGVGINDSDACAKFLNDGEFDCVLLAGRYTLLDQSALNDVFPIAQKNKLGVILAGVYNSGILAKGIGKNITYFYKKIPKRITKKYILIKKICDKFNVPIPAAAIQFCYFNKLVSSMVIGMDNLQQIQQNINYLNHPIPKELWTELLKNQLIDERCFIK